MDSNSMQPGATPGFSAKYFQGDEKMEYAVLFQPLGYTGQFEAGTSLLDAARRTGVFLEAPCGGNGRCGKCKVRLMSVETDWKEKEKELLKPEELQAGYRLACCVTIEHPLQVEIPETSCRARQRVMVDGVQRPCSLRPAVSQICVELNKPTLKDAEDDFSRLQKMLQSRLIQSNKRLCIDPLALAELPGSLRRNRGWGAVSVTLWKEKEIIAVEAGAGRGLYGAAFDIGTTTLAGYLCDLQNGRVVAQASRVNSQVSYGDDVLSRISAAEGAAGLKALREAVLEDLNAMLAEMALQAEIALASVSDIVAVCNTVMHHLFLGLSPKAVGVAPFVAVLKEAADVKARDLGVKGVASGCYVHCLPLEAGFVGADNVAALLSERPYMEKKLTLLVDIGTNGEINLSDSHQLYTASCATGPALEGAQIRFGMRAASGAIEAVELAEAASAPFLRVIGGQKPAGICGSGIIDAVAALFKTGIIKADGTFRKDLALPRVRRGADGKWEYVLAWAEESLHGDDIAVTQPDVRAVQLAKAALYAGAKMLLRRCGAGSVERIVLAGAFGSYINKENAMVLGLIPDCDLDQVTAVGNAAGEGAKRALLDREEREEARRIVGKVHFVETAAEKDFQEEFMQAMYLPHKSDSFSHVQHILANIPGASSLKEATQ